MRRLKQCVNWIVFFLIYMPWFVMLENRTGVEYIILHTVLDDAIPFCRFFIIPYLFWFPCMLGTVFYLLLMDEDIHAKTSICLMSGMMIFLVLSTLFPTAQDLRPSAVQNDLFGRLVLQLYARDTSTNIFPSIHVLNTLFAAQGICSLKDSRLHRVLKPAVVASAVLIVLSTLALKQHSVIDVAGAFVLYKMIGAVYTKVNAHKTQHALQSLRVS